MKPTSQLSPPVIPSDTCPSPCPLPAPAQTRRMQRAGRGIKGEGVFKMLYNVRVYLCPFVVSVLFLTLNLNYAAMDKINFCVSILNGQFKTASFRRGSVAGLWEGPELREDFTDLRATLKEALLRTKVDGKSAAVVMALPRLSD